MKSYYIFPQTSKTVYIFTFEESNIFDGVALSEAHRKHITQSSLHSAFKMLLLHHLKAKTATMQRMRVQASEICLLFIQPAFIITMLLSFSALPGNDYC